MSARQELGAFRTARMLAASTAANPMSTPAGSAVATPPAPKTAAPEGAGKTGESEGTITLPPDIPEGSREAMEKLIAALKDAGLDPAALQLRPMEEVVKHPGGGYLCKRIEVNCNGLMEYVDTDLTAMYPELSAKCIQNALAWSGNV